MLLIARNICPGVIFIAAARDHAEKGIPALNIVAHVRGRSQSAARSELAKW